jgi:hypothetical protein
MLMRSAATLNGHKRKSGESNPNRCIIMHVLQVQAQLFIAASSKCITYRFINWWLTDFHSSLKTKASRKHGKEYSKARARYPSPEN